MGLSKVNQACFEEESSMHDVNCIYGENIIRGIFDRSTCRAK